MKVSISGIRGIFGNDFTLKDVMRFCTNFSKLVESKKCIVAMDTRPSSKMILDAASATLMENGIDIYNLGMVPTPVAFRESRNFTSGLMITSSHNPLQWNGLKFILKGRIINEKELKVVTTKQENLKTKIGSETNIQSKYVEEAYNLIGKKSDAKVTVDIGGGAAKDIAPNLLEKIGCNVKTINEDINQVSRGPDPTTDDLDELVSNTNEQDLGFAFDLDGDRLVVVKDGKKQSPDVTLGLGIVKALELGYKKFVLSLDTSISIEKYITKMGGTVQRSAVGEANVIDLMLETKSQAGGEGSSGGFILPEFNYCRDGILTSGFIASMHGTKPMDDLLNFMKNYHQKRDKVEIDSKVHDRVIEKLLDKMKKQYNEIITLDGIKAIIDDNTWVLVRKSNTEDIIRISAESNELEKTRNIFQQVKDLVKQSYEEVK
ncbi:MAG: phosphomannomutase [Nitrosopumilaceae archaeon]